MFGIVWSAAARPRTKDLLKIPALVVPLLSMSVTAYKWSRDSSCDSSVPLFLDNECVICLCDLGVSNAEILPCGHAPWPVSSDMNRTLSQLVGKREDEFALSLGCYESFDC